MYSIVFCFIGRILCVLGQTSFCGEVGFGIWLKNFPWCLKAKFQIPPLRRRMFVINTTTVLLQVPRFVSVWQLESYFLATTWLAGEISGVWEKVRFQIFPWCLSQTPLQNLFSVVFDSNTTVFEWNLA